MRGRIITVQTKCIGMVGLLVKTMINPNINANAIDISPIIVNPTAAGSTSIKYSWWFEAFQNNQQIIIAAERHEAEEKAIQIIKNRKQSALSKWKWVERNLPFCSGSLRKLNFSGMVKAAVNVNAATIDVNIKITSANFLALSIFPWSSVVLVPDPLKHPFAMIYSGSRVRCL